MATVPRNPDGPPYRPYLYDLKRPQTRRTNSLTGSLSNAAGGPARSDPTQPRGPQSPGNFAPQIRPEQNDINGTLTTTEKCGTEMHTLHLGRLIHAEICTSYGTPPLNVRESQAHCRPLPRPTSTCVSTDSSYANLLTSGAMSAPAKTSSKCGICKNVPESSISPKPSTDAVMPFIAATDSKLQNRLVYASFMDF